MPLSIQPGLHQVAKLNVFAMPGTHLESNSGIVSPEDFTSLPFEKRIKKLLGDIEDESAARPSA